MTVIGKNWSRFAIVVLFLVSRAAIARYNALQSHSDLLVGKLANRGHLAWGWHQRTKGRGNASGKDTESKDNMKSNTGKSDEKAPCSEGVLSRSERWWSLHSVNAKNGG